MEKLRENDLHGCKDTADGMRGEGEAVVERCRKTHAKQQSSRWAAALHPVPQVQSSALLNDLPRL